ncbi:glutaredoxin family protein [Priestia megaterium]|uniref:glutaredoxin family protein n=1 Tax=Priestia megaterium TaxID=1404 RepID=UPI003CF151E1
MKLEIVIFTQEGCIHCKRQKEWFSQNNIDYREKRINKSDLMFSKRKITGTPYTVVKFLDDTEIVVEGFNLQKLERILLEK